MDYIKDKSILQYNFKKRIPKIEKYFERSANSAVLEIGCAYGFFGEVLKNHFTNVDYCGVDIVPEAIQYGKEKLNLSLKYGDYLKLKSPHKYSSVFMWDVIEHLENPSLFIEKVNSELAENGYLYITTGNIAGLLPKLQGRKWRMIHPPTHLHYFSKKTIKHLLEKYGFEVVEISHPSVYRSIKQVFYSLFILNRKGAKWKQRIFSKLSDDKYFKVNTFDIMFVIAKKKYNY